MSLLREPPHDAEAEMALLSCSLLDGANAIGAAMTAGVSGATFYDPNRSTIYDRLVSMVAEGKPIDLPTLASEMKRTGELESVGGYTALIEVSQSMPTTARAGYFADRLRELQTLREAIAGATALIERCYTYSGGGVDAEIGPIAAKLLSAISGQAEQAEKPWGAVVGDALAQVDALCTPGATPRRSVSLGWPSLDLAFEPMRPGQLVVVGARPSVGKSSLLRPMAYGAAKAGQHVYFATLEVKPASVAMQFAASIANIGVRRLAKAHHNDQRIFRETLEGLKSLPIHVHDTRRTLASITAKARALHARRPLDLIAIDYLGLVVDCDIGDHKPSAIGRVTKALKRLAADLDCVVLIACQLSRLSAQDKNREPKLTDLRDSGDIEQDADKVIFIHRPDADGITGMPQSDIHPKEETPSFFQNLIQAKGRDDGTGFASFYFKRETATFHPAMNPTRKNP